jgi:hypothetical protein
LQLAAMWSDEPSASELERVGDEIEAARHELALRDPHLARRLDATDVEIGDGRSLARRLATLGEATTLLGALPAGDRLWTYAIWDGGCIVEQRPLEPIVALDDRALARIADALLSPLDERLRLLGRDDHLLISPFGWLEAVPFALLPYRRRYLCEHCVLSLVQGLGVFEACLATPALEFASVLAVGAPTRPELDPLDAAANEAQQIAELFAGHGGTDKLLLRDEATVADLTEHVPQYDTVHIASHAEPPGAGREFASLLMAADFRNGDSGVLSEDRVLSELRLRPGALVNLAGCTTALQQEADGPLLRGLVPAFLVAGAGSVVASTGESPTRRQLASSWRSTSICSRAAGRHMHSLPRSATASQAPSARLTPIRGAGPPSQCSAFAEMTSKRVFISHAGADTSSAEAVSGILAAAGLETVLDRATVAVGDDFIAFMSDALDTSDYCLLLWSVAAAGRPWVQVEWEAALHRTVSESRRFLLVARLEAHGLPALLRPRLAVDLFPQLRPGVDRLVELCRADAHAGETSRRPVAPPQGDVLGDERGEAVYLTSELFAITVPLRVALDVPAGVHLDRIVTAFDLPHGFSHKDRLGVRINYRLAHDGVTLQRQPTLADQGVRTNDVLWLECELVPFAATTPAEGELQPVVFRSNEEGDRATARREILAAVSRAGLGPLAPRAHSH